MALERSTTAHKLGIEIKSEDEFLSIIGNGQQNANGDAETSEMPESSEDPKTVKTPPKVSKPVELSLFDF